MLTFKYRNHKNKNIQTQKNSNRALKIVEQLLAYYDYTEKIQTPRDFTIQLIPLVYIIWNSKKGPFHIAEFN